MKRLPLIFIPLRDHYHYNMKILKFADNLVPLIITGEKTSTWRLFDDKNLSIGDELRFVNKETGKSVATAKIISIREKALGYINNGDFSGHEKFDSKEEMFATYKSYYGDGVREDTLVKMIDFQLK